MLTYHFLSIHGEPGNNLWTNHKCPDFPDHVNMLKHIWDYVCGLPMQGPYLQVSILITDLTLRQVQPSQYHSLVSHTKTTLQASVFCTHSQ